ncbi:hypothetical protein N802_07930 [Knoellia sinensis KCTC 19936]|uniref:Uncharacterized protein n=1 Tax=Knoellia sinensis KCTC 19936 TaxID=1385520 RepID=A0A0A0J956_9MICO|nr:hypothetical protein [Knoellia sinensis]KGN33955.1 hypothetical protein N802_07930 [Knoellia sinensis KCTC 19936]
MRVLMAGVVGALAVVFTVMSLITLERADVIEGHHQRWLVLILSPLVGPIAATSYWEKSKPREDGEPTH